MAGLGGSFTSKQQIEDLWRVHRGAEAVEDRERRARGWFDTRSWRDPSGRQLSDRIWRSRQQTRDAIDATLRRSIADGQNALEVADALEAFLNPGLAPTRVVRGNIVRVLRDDRPAIVTNTPGRIRVAGQSTGYGGLGSYPARRLARTEISRAHGRAERKAAEAVPGMGIRWRLSPSHPKIDICDKHASADIGFGRGVYFAHAVPIYPPHPHCLCSLSRVPLLSDAEIVAQLRKRYDLEEIAGPAPAPSVPKAPVIPVSYTRPAPPRLAAPVKHDPPDVVVSKTQMNHKARAAKVRRTDPGDPFALSDSAEKIKRRDPRASNALTTYTGGSYRRLNIHARGAENRPSFNLNSTEAHVADVKKQNIDTIHAMEDAFRHPAAKLPVDVRAYRGTRFSQGMPPEILNAKPGDFVTDWGFASFTREKDVAESFGGVSFGGSGDPDAVLFDVLLPKGNPGIYVEPFSTHPDEDEVVLPRGSTLIIHAVERQGNLIRITAEYV